MTGNAHGVRWMFHATAIGPSYEGILEPLQRYFGCRVLHVNESAAPGIERRGGMTWIADNSIEIGEPVGPGSPVRRFVERFGGGMHSVAVQVDDLEVALARAAAHGVAVADRPGPGLAFTRPADTAGLLFDWNSNAQDDDPRWGTPPAPPADIEPRFVGFVAAIVKDPVADGGHIAGMLGTTCVVLDPAAAPDVPSAMVMMGDCVLALYRLPSTDEESRSIWGGAYDRPPCLALGLVVDDIVESVQALERSDVGVHHRWAGAVILDPRQLPFPVVVRQTLLPGDPRRG
jgi:Glyoxalase/Bleomycin resistance protein/Dioxygenase superfamily